MSDLVEIKPWFKRPEETQMQYERFQKFLSLEKRGIPPKRRLTDLADLLGVSLTVISRLAKERDWEARTEAYDDFVTIEPMQNSALVKNVEQARNHRRDGQDLIKKGVSRLKSLLDEDAELSRYERDARKGDGETDNAIPKGRRLSAKEITDITRLGINLLDRADKLEAPVNAKETEELNASIRNAVAELTAGLGNMASTGETVVVTAIERTASFRVGDGGRQQVSSVPAITGEICEGDIVSDVD